MNERDLPRPKANKRVNEATPAKRRNPNNGSLSEHALLRMYVDYRTRNCDLIRFEKGITLRRSQLPTDPPHTFVVEKTSTALRFKAVVEELKRGTLQRCLRTIRVNGGMEVSS